MKKLSTTILIFFLFSVTVFAQKTVNASQIIEKINRGEAVKIENARISGVLDFTDLKNRELKESSGLGNSTKTYLSKVKSDIRFINCTFDNDVLAYYHVEGENTTYNADFEGSVVFQDCKFKEASAFKYSNFRQEVDFSGSTFEEEANFKYAKFYQMPVFSKVRFDEDANFKYTEFERGVTFQNATFDDEANFKYTKFPKGVSFKNTLFNDFANFKYTEFKAPLNMEGTKFNSSTDFKYTSLDGKKFNNSLVKNN